jgi:hypothetical protein
MPTRRKKKFEVNYTVGRIEDGNAILLSSEHNILDVPLMLLPKNIKPGNILKFRVEGTLNWRGKEKLRSFQYRNRYWKILTFLQISEVLGLIKL